MLELRPTCEQCNKALPADALDAASARTNAHSVQRALKPCSRTSAPTAVARSRPGQSGRQGTGRAITFLAKTAPARGAGTGPSIPWPTHVRGRNQGCATAIAVESRLRQLMKRYAARNALRKAPLRSTDEEPRVRASYELCADVVGGRRLVHRAHWSTWQPRRRLSPSSLEPPGSSVRGWSRFLLDGPSRVDLARALTPSSCRISMPPIGWPAG